MVGFKIEMISEEEIEWFIDFESNRPFMRVRRKCNRGFLIRWIIFPFLYEMKINHDYGPYHIS